MNIRPLRASDYHRGFYKLLQQLTVAPKVNWQTWLDTIQTVNERGVIVLVAEINCVVVGSITLLQEPKFIHGCRPVLHIEDLVVSEPYRGTGIGSQLLQAAKEFAVETRCYKIILDCSDSTVGFYERCGFTKKQQQMALYLE